MKRFFILATAWGMLLALVSLAACNADPQKVGRRARPVPKEDYIARFAARFKTIRTPIFERQDARKVRIVLRPADIQLSSPKRQDVGVLVQQFEAAQDTLRALELATPRAPMDCGTDWVLHVFGETAYRVDIQWECKTIRIGERMFDLPPGAVKTLGNAITTARLHPTHKATVLQVPVVHEPDVVARIVGEFVQEVLPLDYSRMRYPSFTVSTEHTEALVRDLSQVDAQVARLRERLVGRLNEFAELIRRRGGASIVEILPPFPIRENFTRELHARWGMTVLCALGTGSDRMYWLASSPKFAIVGMEIPTHYPLLVVQLPPADPRPGLAAQIEGLQLDPPVLWPK